MAKKDDKICYVKSKSLVTNVSNPKNSNIQQPRTDYFVSVSLQIDRYPNSVQNINHHGIVSSRRSATSSKRSVSLKCSKRLSWNFHWFWSAKKLERRVLGTICHLWLPFRLTLKTSVISGSFSVRSLVWQKTCCCKSWALFVTKSLHCRAYPSCPLSQTAACDGNSYQVIPNETNEIPLPPGVLPL